MSLGTIKDYTPNFNLIIPEFNISGWHDYLEENFRSIDALLYNLFGINNYSGIWKKLTSYTAGQVVFIGEDTTYSGRLIKILVDHTTTNEDFSTFFENNPTYYELFADASTAQYYALQAKDWAIKMDGPVEGSDYSAKYYANLVDNLSTEIITLYNIANNIQTVANISTDVENVADNETNITTVANNISSVNTIATNITDINTVASISSNVTSVAGNAININSVANNITNITTVSQDLTNINTVASNQTNINTTATNINAINMNASNITAIQNASTYATNAQNSASLAEDWATKTSDTVDGSEYSAKYYAQIAAQHENPLRIGQIIQTTLPLNDAGLHLLDGSIISGNGIYSEFVTFIANLVNTYPNLFETEANWQTSVSTYGVCGKFVYDSINNTVRLPKITGIIEGTTNTNVLGELVEAGLPNITGTHGGADGNDTSVEGCYYNAGGGTSGSGSGPGWKVGFDASRSSSIYGKSDTVQPQTIKALYYIVVATSTKTNIQVDIDEIVTDLNGKVDKNDLATVHCVIETYVNGNSWYRVWSDGWCEQGGYTEFVYNTPITLLKNYINTNWNIQTTPTTDVSEAVSIQIINKTTTSFTPRPQRGTGNASNQNGYWFACGYI